MDDNNLKSEHGRYDSLKVIKAIEEHIREALRLSDAANLGLSKELGDTLSSVIMSREAMESMESESSSPEQIQDLEKEFGKEGASNEPTETSDWGGGQADDLKRLFGALKDDPGDNRLED